MNSLPLFDEEADAFCKSPKFQLGIANLQRGGVTHMAVALSVVMLEITNDFEFLLPILLVVLFAKGLLLSRLTL